MFKYAHAYVGNIIIFYSETVTIFTSATWPDLNSELTGWHRTRSVLLRQRQSRTNNDSRCSRKSIFVYFLGENL